jgi:hypothetical protein
VFVEEIRPGPQAAWQKNSCSRGGDVPVPDEGQAVLVQLFLQGRGNSVTSAGMDLEMIRLSAG